MLLFEEKEEEDEAEEESFHTLFILTLIFIKFWGRDKYINDKKFDGTFRNFGTRTNYTIILYAFLLWVYFKTGNVWE